MEGAKRREAEFCLSCPVGHIRQMFGSSGHRVSRSLAWSSSSGVGHYSCTVAACPCALGALPRVKGGILALGPGSALPCAHTSR